MSSLASRSESLVDPHHDQEGDTASLDDVIDLEEIRFIFHWIQISWRWLQRSRCGLQRSGSCWNMMYSMNENMTVGGAREEKPKGQARSDADSITRVSPGGFARPCDFDDLTSPQSIIPRYRISKLHPRQLCLLQSTVEGKNHASTMSHVFQEGREGAQTILTRVLSFDLGSGPGVLAPVCGA